MIGTHEVRPAIGPTTDGRAFIGWGGNANRTGAFLAMSPEQMKALASQMEQLADWLIALGREPTIEEILEHGRQHEQQTRRPQRLAG